MLALIVLAIAAAAICYFARQRPRPKKEPVEWRLADPNVPADWIETKAWLGWGAPLDVVSGESFYKDVFLSLAGPPIRQGYLIAVSATLRREPDNAHDSNAIRVELGGRGVGHLPRGLAASIAPLLDRFSIAHFSIAGLVRGGSETAPNFGLHLWPERRTSPGPEIKFTGGAFPKAPWPPWDGEGEADL